MWQYDGRKFYKKGNYAIASDRDTYMAWSVHIYGRWLRGLVSFYISVWYPCWNPIYVYHYTNEMELIWNSRNGSFLRDSRGIVWICAGSGDCSTGSLVCNNVSNKLSGTTQRREKRNMSTGKNIKKVRKWREMTQSELGKALGIGEGSAGTRIAQYETEKRTPKGEILGKIAGVLCVNPKCLAAPKGYSEDDMIYRLLILEDYFPEMKLERNSRTGEVVINLQNKKINEFLYQWGTIRGKRKQGMISEDEYIQWRYCRNHA